MIGQRRNLPCFRDDDWVRIREELGLSARELEVVKHVFEGKKLVAAARAMGLSHGTVKTYNQRIHRKLGIADQRELVLSVFAAHRDPGSTLETATAPEARPDLLGLAVPFLVEFALGPRNRLAGRPRHFSVASRPIAEVTSRSMIGRPPGAPSGPEPV